MCKVNWEYVIGIIGALGSVVSAWIAWLVRKQGLRLEEQNKRIKTLTDVVTKFDEQNELLKERNRIDNAAVMNQIIPVFKSINPEGRTPDMAVLHLVNNGVDSNQTYPVGEDNTKYTVLVGHREPRKGEQTMITVQTIDGSTLDNIEFYLVSESVTGLTAKQKIFKYPGHHINIGPPEY